MNMFLVGSDTDNDGYIFISVASTLAIAIQRCSEAIEIDPSNAEMLVIMEYPVDCPLTINKKRINHPFVVRSKPIAQYSPTGIKY